MWTYIFCQKHWAKRVDPRFFLKKWCQKPQITKWHGHNFELIENVKYFRYGYIIRSNEPWRQNRFLIFDEFFIFFRLRKQFIDRMMSNYYCGREAAYAATTKILLYLKMLDFQQILTSQIFPEHYSQRTCQKPWPIFTLHHHQEWCSHLHHHGNEAVIGLYFPIQPSGVFTTDKIDLKIPRWWWSKSHQFTHSEDL